MRQPFDTSKPFTARKDLVFAGVAVRRGDRFEAERLGCDERKLRQLWEQKAVECGELPASLRPTAPTAPTARDPAVMTDAELEAATAPSMSTPSRRARARS